MNTRNDMIIGLHLLEEDARQLQTAGFQAFGEARANSGWTEASEHHALRIHARSLVLEDLLYGDRLAFHAGDFRNRRDAARTVRHARDLQHDVDGRRHLLAHRTIRKAHTRHLDHGLESRQGVAWCVGVNGCQRTIVACVHGLKHVDSLTATDLADHDAIWTHTKCVAHEITLRDFTTTFNVWRPCFEPDCVRLLELKFRRVFDRDDAL